MARFAIIYLNYSHRIKSLTEVDRCIKCRGAKVLHRINQCWWAAVHLFKYFEAVTCTFILTEITEITRVTTYVYPNRTSVSTLILNQYYFYCLFQIRWSTGTVFWALIPKSIAVWSSQFSPVKVHMTAMNVPFSFPKHISLMNWHFNYCLEQGCQVLQLLNASLLQTT